MKKISTISCLTRHGKTVATAFFLVLCAASSSFSEEKWKTSFHEICSKVDASGTLSTQELSDLVVRLDKLSPEIQSSSDPSKKIYLQRLKKCRSMYEFMIDTKKEPGK